MSDSGVSGKLTIGENGQPTPGVQRGDSGRDEGGSSSSQGDAPPPDGMGDAELMAVVVGPYKAGYYLPRFARFDAQGGALSWNWSAFFLPTVWAVYRRMYGTALVLLVANLALPRLPVPPGFTPEVWMVVSTGALCLGFPSMANWLYYRHACWLIAHGRAHHRQSGTLMAFLKHHNGVNITFTALLVPIWGVTLWYLALDVTRMVAGVFGVPVTG